MRHTVLDGTKLDRMGGVSYPAATSGKSGLLEGASVCLSWKGLNSASG